MTENNSEKERQALKPIFHNEKIAQNNSAEALHEKLRGMASEKTGTDKPLKNKPSHEIFRIQEKIEGKKNSAKNLMITSLVALLLVGIGYPAKLAYEGKVEVKKLTMDYKSLQIALAAVNQRDHKLYRKIFPQVEELNSTRIESALKGIEDSIDMAAKINLEAGDLWARKQYDQAMKLYVRAAKINPLNDKSAYLLKEAELTKHDQASFKRFYIVQEGDDLKSIAKRAGISEQRIINANGPRYAALYGGHVAEGMQLALPVAIGGPPY